MAVVMDVVVPCDCGTRFSFSVEPINGRLPDGAELLCPGCGKDGVPLANRVINDDLRKQQREKERQEREAAAQQPKKNGWLKLDKKKQNNEAAQPDPHASSAYPADAHDPFAKARNKDDDSVYTGPNRVKGIAGALVGGMLGAAAWAATVYFTGYEIKYVAVGVGALTGLGSRFIGGGRDYHLGLFASACALVAILMGQFFAAQIYLDKTLSVELARMEYEMRLDEAKEAAELKTQEDYREFIAASKSTIYKPVAPESVTAKEILDFQAAELPKLKKLANGEPAKEAFIQEERKSFLAKQTVKDIFILSISPYLFFWVAVGVGAAWKLASDYGTSVE